MGYDNRSLNELKNKLALLKLHDFKMYLIAVLSLLANMIQIPHWLNNKNYNSTFWINIKLGKDVFYFYLIK